MKRRLPIALALLAAGFLALALWALRLEPDSLVVRPYAIASPRWTLPPLRIGVLADLHVGARYVDRAKVARVVDETNAQHPDLVVLLGDYVNERPHDPVAAFAEVVPELRRLSAPLGVWAVLGNHDWLHGGQQVWATLASANVHVLENEAQPVRWQDHPVWIAGLADLWTRQPLLSKALAAVPDAEPVLVLTHNPDVFVQMPERVALTLAGHTHGGQVALPLLGRPVVPSAYGERYVLGHVEEGGRHLFINTGIGTSVYPIRFGVPPEISIITLSGAAAPPSVPRVEPRH